MRHRVRTHKFGRDKAHTTAMMRNLVTSLVLHEKIRTTSAKARALEETFSTLVTRVRGKEMHNQIRLLSEVFYSDIPSKKMREVLLPRFEGRASGFIRTTKLTNRKGDNAPVVLVEFVS